MKIKALTTFKHDTFIAEAGKTYEVPEGLAAYFINSGWAEGPDGERVYSVPSEHIIEVDDTSVSPALNQPSVNG